MSVAVYLPNPDRCEDWCVMLRELLPGWTIEPLDAVQDPAAVDYAVVWRPRTGDLARFANLKATVSIGAGIDHVLADTSLPQGVPIIRTVGADLTQRMREYVALHVLRHHRDMPAMLAAQARGAWFQPVVPPATGRRVGVMGLGNLGKVAATTLAALGFQVTGWARTPREVPGVEVHAGVEGLDAFLAGTEILVNLLPLTPETTGILNAGLFARLAPGAALINAARGPHLVDDDLVAALDAGQLGQATLDVFHVEPLPKDHRFWTDPRITITAHTASLIDPGTGARIIARNLHDFDRDGTVADLADAARGY
ncbi:2-hydroxyacid dehydrogenase [Acidimangrovimonas sediminis]|uniref:2-hydroxyacid dehydrogenase n=1 Tax=Acidimangrovimonas sediminis TaxID=2056283 RepID=UPI000C80D3FE|nr:glyoxylate/hydroxypyruvate reductase A [Acidimangrovimonas sediminis]